LSQFKAKALLVHGLEEPASSVPVHFYGQTDDPISKTLLDEHHLISVALRAPRSSSVVKPSQV
jgi:hypothetical protein